MKFSQHLDVLCDLLEDGPVSDESPVEFLRAVTDEARSLVGALEALVPSDVDVIWQEETETV